MLAILLPNKADAICNQLSVPQNVNTWSQAEHELKIVDHTTLGEIACRIWGLPDFIVDSVVGHHRNKNGHKINNSSIVDIVTLSNQIMHWVSLNPSRIDQDLMHSISNKLGIDESQLEKFCEDAMPLADQASELAVTAT